MTINKRRPELFALSDRNSQQRFRARWRRPGDKSLFVPHKGLDGGWGRREGWDGRCQVTQSCSGQLSLVFEPQEIYTNTHYSPDKKTYVCWPGNIQTSPVLHSPAIKAPAGHMEDIKLTRVNYIAGRWTGWLTRHVATPTNHGELGCRQRDGECRAEGRRCERWCKPRRAEKKGIYLEPKVTMPNDVTALICWRLAVERVFNQSV